MDRYDSQSDTADYARRRRRCRDEEEVEEEEEEREGDDVVQRVRKRARMRASAAAAADTTATKQDRYDDNDESDKWSYEREEEEEEEEEGEEEEEDDEGEEEEEGEEGEGEDVDGVRQLQVPSMNNHVAQTGGIVHIPNTATRPISLDVAASRMRAEVESQARELAFDNERRRQEYMRVHAATGASTAAARPYLSYCFLCEYGNRAFDGTDLGCGPVVEMNNIIVENFGHMSNESIGNIVEDYYRRHLYTRTLDPVTQQPILPVLTSRTVVEHIEGHTHNQILNIGRSKSIISKAINIISNHLVLEDNSINYKGFETLCKLVDRQARLFSMKTDDTTGGDSSIQLDPAAVESVINTRRIRPLMLASNASGGSGSGTTTTTAAAAAAAESGRNVVYADMDVVADIDDVEPRQDLGNTDDNSSTNIGNNNNNNNNSNNSDMHDNTATDSARMIDTQQRQQQPQQQQQPRSSLPPLPSA